MAGDRVLQLAEHFLKTKHGLINPRKVEFDPDESLQEKISSMTRQWQVPMIDDEMDDRFGGVIMFLFASLPKENEMMSLRECNDFFVGLEVFVGDDNKFLLGDEITVLDVVVAYLLGPSIRQWLPETPFWVINWLHAVQFHELTSFEEGEIILSTTTLYAQWISQRIEGSRWAAPHSYVDFDHRGLECTIEVMDNFELRGSFPSEDLVRDAEKLRARGVVLELYRADDYHLSFDYSGPEDVHITRVEGLRWGHHGEPLNFQEILTILRSMNNGERTYREYDYVVKELKSLVDQLLD